MLVVSEFSYYQVKNIQQQETEIDWFLMHAIVFRFVKNRGTRKSQTHLTFSRKEER